MHMWYRVYLITGIILLFISLAQVNDSLRFVRRSERIAGTVTAMDTLDGSDAGITYAPVFTITTLRNQKIIYRHHAASSPPSWAIGEQTTFLYDPKDLSVRMYDYFSLFSWGIVLMGAGVFLFTLGGAYFWLRPCWR